MTAAYTTLAAIGGSLHAHPLPWALGWTAIIVATFRLDEDLIAGVRMLVAILKREATT